MTAARVGQAILALLALVALGADLLYPGDPLAIAGPPLLPPLVEAAFPLGTDQLGRDVAAELCHGARISLVVALAAAAGALGLGILVGAASGYLGGWADAVLMRLTEAFQTVPGFLLALALVAVLGPSLPSIVAAVALTSWTGPARIMRAEMLSLRGRDFVDAYRCMGMGRAEIIFRQLLPNALPPVVALAAIIAASAILVESALSFLGFGDPNRISWGGMIAGGRAVLRSAWSLSAIPGVAVVATVIAINLAGDGLRARR